MKTKISVQVLASFLIPTFTLPYPALAFRSEATQEASGLEEVRTALHPIANPADSSSPLFAGVEESAEEVLKRKLQRASKLLKDVIGLREAGQDLDRLLSSAKKALDLLITVAMDHLDYYRKYLEQKVTSSSGIRQRLQDFISQEKRWATGKKRRPHIAAPNITPYGIPQTRRQEKMEMAKKLQDKLRDLHQHLQGLLRARAGLLTGLEEPRRALLELLAGEEMQRFVHRMKRLCHDNPAGIGRMTSMSVAYGTLPQRLQEAGYRHGVMEMVRLDLLRGGSLQKLGNRPYEVFIEKKWENQIQGQLREAEKRKVVEFVPEIGKADIVVAEGEVSLNPRQVLIQINSETGRTVTDELLAYLQKEDRLTAGTIVVLHRVSEEVLLYFA